MSRIVFLGGFANGRGSAEAVGNELGRYYEDVDVFTFSDYVKDPDSVRQAAAGIGLMVHSAGALALRELAVVPDQVTMLNPPLPSSIPRILARTAVKQLRMSIPRSGDYFATDLAAASRYSVSSLAELASNPVANFSKLGEISRFDAVSAAIAAKDVGVPAHLIWTSDDAYFCPNNSQRIEAFNNHVPVTMLEGQHDEVVLRPAEFIPKVLNVV